MMSDMVVGYRVGSCFAWKKSLKTMHCSSLHLDNECNWNSFGNRWLGFSRFDVLDIAVDIVKIFGYLRGPGIWITGILTQEHPNPVSARVTLAT
jgi:hypothetical protein